VSLIVHINGWPGSGKFTIGRLLAKRLKAKLLDNHTLLNPAEALFERDDPNYWPLRGAIRNLVIDAASKVPPAIPIVFTDALADDRHDAAIFETCRTLAERRRVPIVSVVLDCDIKENLRRLLAPGRADLLKLTNSDVLLDLRAQYQLLRPAGVERLDLEVSALTAQEAAAAIYKLLERFR
jgi:thymidylate kinase